MRFHDSTVKHDEKSPKLFFKHLKNSGCDIPIWVFPRIGVFPPKSSILIGFSIIFPIHFGGFSHDFWFNIHIPPISTTDQLEVCHPMGSLFWACKPRMMDENFEEEVGSSSFFVNLFSANHTSISFILPIRFQPAPVVVARVESLFKTAPGGVCFFLFFGLGRGRCWTNSYISSFFFLVGGMGWEMVKFVKQTSTVINWLESLGQGQKVMVGVF